MDNHCWKETNFLLDEEKFKFLVHSEAGKPWLAGTEQEMSQLVEDVTKAGGFYPADKFTVLTNISVQCQGGDKWNFSTTEGSARFAGHFNCSGIFTPDLTIFQLQLSEREGTFPQVSCQFTSRLCPVSVCSDCPVSPLSSVWICPRWENSSRPPC